MLVQLGNANALDANRNPLDLGAPSVTYVNIPDHLGFDPDMDVNAFRNHMYDAIINNDGVTNYENAEALLAVAHASQGAWTQHGKQTPLWVYSDNEAFASVLAAFYQTPTIGAPSDLEDTYWTQSGPPGVAMSDGPTALLVNAGRDIWAAMQGGGAGNYAGTATATSSNSLTATGTPFVASAYIGCMVVAGTVYGIVVSNTTSVLTIDRWYNPATPGALAGSTPSGTTTFSIIPGNPPAQFMGLSTTNTASVATDTSMAGEIVNGTPAGETNVAGTLPSGLLRQIATYAHSAGASTYTMTGVFTVNASDAILPQTIYRMGLFKSLISTDTANSMMFETLLSASATVSAIGDQLTTTETVTGS